VREQLTDEGAGISLSLVRQLHSHRFAYETGWNTPPEVQGRGVAREALRQLIAQVVARGDRGLLVAYHGQDNPGSNALCRGAGFAHTGTGTMPWRGGELAYNVWELALSAS